MLLKLKKSGGYLEESPKLLFEIICTGAVDGEAHKLEARLPL